MSHGHPDLSVTEQEGGLDVSTLGRDSQSQQLQPPPAAHQPATTATTMTPTTPDANPTTIVGASAPPHPTDVPPKDVAASLASGDGASGDKSFAPVIVHTQGPQTGAMETTAPGAAPSGAKRQILMKRVTEPRYVTSHRKGWSIGRKICCGLMLFLLAALITVGVLIAFLVRTPTVQYRSAVPYCAEGTSLASYYSCVRTYVQIRVLLTIDNPNIIGATVNADLGLFKEDGTFLGPGTIGDTAVGARGQTDVVANFNITSDRGFDILKAIFIPPTYDVTVHVDGSVFIHVGLLRPSIGISEDFVVPKQSLGSIGSLVNSQLPVGGATDILDSISGRSGGRQLDAASPQQLFSQAIATVGAPTSDQRKAFDANLARPQKFHALRIVKMQMLTKL